MTTNEDRPIRQYEVWIYGTQGPHEFQVDAERFGVNLQSGQVEFYKEGRVVASFHSALFSAAIELSEDPGSVEVEEALLPSPRTSGLRLAKR